MDDDESVYEKYTNNSPEPLNIKATENILQQMKNCVCKIYNGKDGTGFFIKIPYKTIILPVIMTNNHVINENDIINNKMITISLNNEEESKIIKIDKDRFFYTNEDLDVTIIEIKEEEDNINNFLELDEKINECLNMSNEEISIFLKNIYSNKSIYTLNYPEGKEVVVSYAQPPEILDKKINHKCQTKEGSSGSPILLSHNQKVIGIHYGTSNKFDFNKGLLIIYPIIELNKKEKTLYNIKNKKIIKKEKKKELNDEKKNEKIKFINLFGNDFIKNNMIDGEILEKEFMDNHYLTKDDFKKEKIIEIANNISNLLREISQEKNKLLYKKIIKYFFVKYYNDYISENSFEFENFSKKYNKNYIK